MSYTNKGQIQKYIAVDIDSSFDTQLTNWITAVQNWIDKYCGYGFEVSASEDRYYDGSGERRQLIDIFFDSPTVVILEPDGTTQVNLTEGHASDYLVYPLNEDQKWELVLVSSSRLGNFPNRSRSVKVTATFGWSSTPPQAIQLIATKLVGEIIKEGLKGGKLSSVELGDYKASFQRINEKSEQLGIYNTLDQYRFDEI